LPATLLDPIARLASSLNAERKTESN